jgi:large subunit ribosomal protein L13
MGVMRDGHARSVPFVRAFRAGRPAACARDGRHRQGQAPARAGPTVLAEKTTIHTRRLRTVRTFSPKDRDITRQWHVVDASDVVLGRLASHVAVLLRGKHKPVFAPHVDTGDFVIVVNAAKVALSGSKLENKRAYRHSGYPGGLRSVSYASLMASHPERVVEKAVRGMLPKNALGRKTLRKLKVYAGPDHPHQAQQPRPYQITQIEQ